MQRECVEFRRQHQRTLGRHIDEASQCEYRDHVVVLGLHQVRLEIGPLDLETQHVVTRCTSSGFELLRLHHALVGELQVGALNLDQSTCEKRVEIGALDVDDDQTADLSGRGARRTANRAGGFRAGKDTPAKEQRLRELCGGAVVVRLTEHRADDRGARVLDDLRIGAREPKLRQTGGTCDTDLRIGNVDSNGGGADFFAVTQGARDCGVEGEREGIGGQPFSARNRGARGLRAGSGGSDGEGYGDEKPPAPMRRAVSDML